jgi:hypothetical protein
VSATATRNLKAAPSGSRLTMTPADILKLQNDWVREGKCIPLGRLVEVAIGPHQNWHPEDYQNDPYIRRNGRFMRFAYRTRRNVQAGMVPLAWGPDNSTLLVGAHLRNEDGYPELPDVSPPEWAPEPWTPAESQGLVERDPAKDTRPMIPQRLRDRADGYMEGTYFYTFSPVLFITFQPELKAGLWRIVCLPDFTVQPAAHTTLLVERRTGEMHFFGGRYEIETAIGEN